MHYRWLVFLFLATGTWAEEKTTVGGRDVTFDRDIQPILKASCVRCHGPRQQKGGLQLDTREMIMSYSGDGAVVRPGEAEKSPLYIAAARLNPNNIMPPAGKSSRPLTDEEIILLREWIDQGAK